MVDTGQAPFIKIRIDENGRLCISSARSELEECKPIFEVPLANFQQMNSGDPFGALGKAVLDHLSFLYPDSFAGVETDSNSDHDMPELDIGHLLLRKSMREKTSFYVDVMERIFSELSSFDTEGSVFYRESWPTLRDHLKSFPNR